MTTAKKYRQLEDSPAINVARFIFGCVNDNSTVSTLGDEVIEVKTGKTPSKQNKKFYEDEYLSWFKPNEIGSEKYLFQAKDKLSKFTYDNNQATIYEPDTILINAIGDIGRISILKIKASSNQQITGIRLNEKIDVDYAYFYLLANRHYFYIDLFQTTLPIINQKKINSIPFVYPEIEEQRNIVAGLVKLGEIKSVEDLFIIDTINWNEDLKYICHKIFNVHFNSYEISKELSHQRTLVKKLRQQLLQDAVQGKLVAQNQNDEPASELLKKIKAEKEKLIAEKQLKKEKELPPIKPKEIPFEIPKNWVWSRLGELAYITSGSTPDRTAFTETGIPYLKMYNLRNQKIDFYYKPQYIKEEVHNGQLKRCRAYSGDIIMNIVGPPLGKIAIIPEFLPECNFNQAAVLIRPLIPEMNTYIFWYLNELSEIRSIETKGVAGQDNISVTQAHHMRIPIPPLSQQTRIVEKLNELMKFCDGLEASIKESEVQNEKLLQQFLREALRK